MVTAIENRLGETLGEKIEAPDWEQASSDILAAARGVLERQRERLVGENGQIARDIQTLSRQDGADEDTAALQMLLTLTQAARTVFDQRTHRQLKQVFNRFSYVYLAAQLLQDREAEELADDVLEHLDAAEQALQIAWGQGEFNRLSANAQRLADFGPAARTAFGEERLNDPAGSLGESDREALVEAIGRYILNEVQRQLLLSAITELWVDYLTRVEALRVSIGLEAYAQRDPLVQYKSKASELYQQLLEDIRGQVINRVFAYQPRRIEIAPVEVAETASVSAPGREADDSSGGKKRKRRRH
jgi:preprotein translocase subunit SecA